MGKELSEMALEELWDLFPIFLVQHDDRWYEYYKEIESTITDLLASYPVKRISHIGSTAIQGIWAKNIVDVMVEISEKADMEEVSIEGIPKTDLRRRFITFILDTQEIMMSCIFVII